MLRCCGALVQPAVGLRPRIGVSGMRAAREVESLVSKHLTLSAHHVVDGMHPAGKMRLCTLVGLALLRHRRPAARSFSLKLRRAFLSEALASSFVTEDWPQEDRVTESRLCHGWRIAQLCSGYRYCADDVVCAYLALSSSPDACSLLDLGSGVGTIGLIWLAQKSRPLLANLTCLEAQAVSVALCRKTVALNGIEELVSIHHGDLRDASTLAAVGHEFEIITANPPYMPQNVGAIPQHPQRAFCRHELRGGIPEYCDAIVNCLAPEGRLCLVHAAAREEDVLASFAASGLFVHRRLALLFHGREKSVAYVCARQPPIRQVQKDQLEVFLKDGKCGPEYVAMCKALGL